MTKRLLKISDIISQTVGWVILIITLLVVYDVTLRYVFQLPSEWPHYLNMYGFGYVIMLGGISVQAAHLHVRSDIISSRVGLKAQAILNVVSSLCAIGFCGILAWAGWLVFKDAFILKTLHSGVLAWPLWPQILVIPIGAALTGLLGVRDFFNALGSISRTSQGDKNMEAGS